jgi:dTDP-4-amino-4,6-dideoxygalactose transaminase
MLTNDDELADRARVIANHGQRGKHNHIMEGRNSRLDGMQGAILSAKLPHLESWTEKRIANAARYNSLITNPNVVKPITRAGYRHVFHLYVIRVKDRTGLGVFLKEKGIETAVHYPTPLPLLPCYQHGGYTAADFPVTSKFQQEIISLPMYAELSSEQIQYVAENVNAWTN